MQKKSSDPVFPLLPRVAQENSYYCGPAVLKALLAFYGKEVTQDEIVAAAGVAHKIKDHGMTVAELALASRTIAPELQFWSKTNSTMGELSALINLQQQPIGIEWQGVFDYPDEDIDEDEDDDPGHFSIITRLDTRNNIVLIADPDRHYAGKDRLFSVLELERRWWDINKVINPFTHIVEEVDDYHVMFFVTKKESVFPENYAMQRG